ncbi:hypothetical protein [Piscirickettsia litoralis]|uniref:hypothetical protein n=1 Tax=Piscirickettsia litoralis TaxID=1891921 RepID=UPI001F31CA8F|nr:hypothetical protein [Piscirickettsia litoralis]
MDGAAIDLFNLLIVKELSLLRKKFTLVLVMICLLGVVFSLFAVSKKLNPPLQKNESGDYSA